MILLAFWFAFAINQIIILSNRSDYVILEKSYANELTFDKFKFSKKDGLAIAAAFYSYSPAYDEEDPEIGELKFILKYWDDSSKQPSFKELRKRPCEVAEMRGTDSDYGFFKM